MKKHLAVLAATAVLGVTSAFAANPFADVTPQDWAYQAVAQLAAQGVVNGYPDGTFQGQHNITRYEMAQMVAKAMARQERVDAEQNAIINRLANEFSTELNNLGVRVATLENKVGNFKFTGDARLRYTGTEHRVHKAAADGGEDKLANQSKFDYRGRVKFEATVNDNTKAVVRLVGGKEFGAAGNPKTTIDRLYVQHNFGKYATATVGRYDEVVGAGLTYDDAFEGAKLAFGKDKLNASVSYGYATNADVSLVLGETKKSPYTTVVEQGLIQDEQRNNPQVAVFQVNGKLGKVNAGAFYAKVNGTKLGLDFDKVASVGDSLDFYGVHANTKFGKKVAVDGEFARFKEFKHSKAWTAGLTYGNYNMAKQGTWAVKAQYTNLDAFAPVFSTTYWAPYNQNFKTWSVQGKYAVANNVGLAAYTTIDAKDKHGHSVADYYRAELNYKF